MEVYEFHIEHYDASICVLIGGEIKELKSFLKDRYKRIPTMWSWGNRVYVKDMYGTDGFSIHINYSLPDHDEIFYMWVSNQKLLVHEIIHVTGDILYVRGFKYSEDSEEAWAYLGNEIYNRIKSLIDAREN